MWIMQLIFWEPTGWYWWMPIPNTHVSTPLLQCQPKPPHICWSRTSLILGTPTQSSQTMLQLSLRRSFKHGVGKGALFTSQVYPTTQLQMEQAERLVQTFKQALVKSTLPPKTALQEFLMQYRRTPLAVGYSPSEFLNSRQIRSKIDILPSPAHICQGRQARKATKSQAEEINDQKATVRHIFKVGTPCYALYCGPRQDKDPRWVPAVVTKVFGTRSVNVRVFPKGGTWRRHIEQLRPRYGAHEDADPGEPPTFSSSTLETANQPSEVYLDTAQSEEGAKAATPELQFPVRPYDLPKKSTRNPRLPNGTEYDPGNPRRSTRQRK